MAASTLLAVRYIVPGEPESEIHFSSMCKRYMNDYFPDFTNDSCQKSVHLVPHLPQYIPPEPPQGSSGGAKLSSVRFEIYNSFRRDQKTKIREYTGQNYSKIFSR